MDLDAAGHKAEGTRLVKQGKPQAAIRCYQRAVEIYLTTDTSEALNCLVNTAVRTQPCDLLGEHSAHPVGVVGLLHSAARAGLGC